MTNENLENQRKQIKRNPTRFNTNIKRGQDEKKFDTESSPPDSETSQFENREKSGGNGEGGKEQGT